MFGNATRESGSLPQEAMVGLTFEEREGLRRLIDERRRERLGWASRARTPEDAARAVAAGAPSAAQVGRLLGVSAHQAGVLLAEACRMGLIERAGKRASAWQYEPKRTERVRAAT